MPFVDVQTLRENRFLLADAALEINRLSDNIEHALQIIEHFGRRANPEAIKEVLLKDHDRAPR